MKYKVGDLIVSKRVELPNLYKVLDVSETEYQLIVLKREGKSTYTPGTVFWAGKYSVDENGRLATKLEKIIA